MSIMQVIEEYSAFGKFKIICEGIADITAQTTHKILDIELGSNCFLAVADRMLRQNNKRPHYEWSSEYMQPWLKSVDGIEKIIGLLDYTEPENGTIPLADVLVNKGQHIIIASYFEQGQRQN